MESGEEKLLFDKGEIKPGPKCSHCEEGHIIGIFMTSCDNPKCPAYFAPAFRACGNCGVPRYRCSC